ncbi:MAG: ribonuclease R [Candidatus Tectomicrobia bacterium]|nr:ribonuclease R [Candidatus Tectomicrobia bacterium]
MMVSEDEILDFLRRMAPRAVPAKELYRALGVQPDERRSLKRLLRELAANGQVARLKGARFALANSLRGGRLRGVFRSHPKGFGFVTPHDRGMEDLYIAAAATGGALHGDEVEVRLHAAGLGSRRAGEVTRVVQRGQREIIGQLLKVQRHALLVPVDRRLTVDIVIPWKERNGAEHGQMVLAEVTEYPTARRPMRARVLKLLGDPDDHEVLAQIILHEHGVTQEFPRAVVEAAAACPERIPASEPARRRDLRPWPCVTIDGETARDFDDAVSVRRLEGGGFELGVHIADVSWYVEEGSPLDLEAYDRGTSIYLPERAIPMLPERLSTHLCSLRPDADRLTLSAIMRFDADGAPQEAELCESVIRSRARLTYTAIQQLFARLDAERAADGGAAKSKVAARSARAASADEPPAELHDDLLTMRELAHLLRARRMRAGSLDFDLPEPDFILDESGSIVHIEELAADEAHHLIEEFMLAANRTVARQLRARKIPLPYRIHEPPPPNKVALLGDVMTRFGHRFEVDPQAPNQKELQALLDAVRDTPEARILHTLVLRTMKQARYDTFNVGHFGLAFDLYTHFTSPIRRYPDLLVHRHLRRFFFQGEPVPEESLWHERLAAAARTASERERRADRVENAVNDLKTAAYMANHLGEEYEGFITDLVSFGFFVELTTLFVHGLVHLATLRDDHYLLDEETFSLVGVRTGRVFHLGDRVRIRVRQADLLRRRIDFELLAVLEQRRWTSHPGRQRHAARQSWRGERRGGGSRRP